MFPCGFTHTRCCFPNNQEDDVDAFHTAIFWGRGQLIHVHEAAIYLEQIWSRSPCLHSLFAPKQKPASHKCVNYILPSPFTLQTVQSQRIFKTQRLTRSLILRKAMFSFQSSNSAVLYIRHKTKKSDSAQSKMMLRPDWTECDGAEDEK